jgi:hypothetical protein
MTIFSKIAETLGFGPDRWDERLADSLVMISPEGKEFAPKWKESNRTREKKLGIFSYPKINGNIVQDKNSNSARYTLPFYFDGDDNDIDANDFFRATNERGTWQITHPVHGFYELQLISVTETDAPVDRGNITALETEWIEPIDEDELVTGRQLAGVIDASIDELNVNAAQQFADNIKSASETLKQNIEDATNLLDDMTEYAMSPLFTSVSALNSGFRAIQDGIQDTLLATIYKMESLAGQIQNLVQICSISTSDINSRTDAYDSLKTSIFLNLETTSGETDEQAVNNAVMQELALSSVVASFAKIAITAQFDSKVQAVNFSDTVIALLNDITNALDTAQKDFIANDFDLQYFSQTQSYSSAAKLVGQVVQYLFITVFNLKIEKRFILDKPMCPIDIVINEYGSLGENDSNFDLFISSNELKGTDIILLPAGREVLIYA